MQRKQILYLLAIVALLVSMLPLGAAAQDITATDDTPRTKSEQSGDALEMPLQTGIEGVATDYGWSQSTGAYTEITGGTQLTTSCDDTSYNAQAIPFPFTFDGTAYTQFSLNCNGFIAMGATVANSYIPISGGTGTSNNVIVAMGHDLQTNATDSEIRYETLGTTPNQILVVQWKNFRHYGATGDVYNFQIRLYETSNLVEVVYGLFTQNATSRTAQVGLRGASNADYNNRTGTGDWTASTAGAANTATMALTSTFVPLSGLTWTWTPLPPSPNFNTSYKTAPAQGLVGDTIAYTVHIVNSGRAAANAATMVDPIPAGATYVPGSVTGGASYNAGSNSITWAGTVAIGASVVISFSVDTDGAPCGLLVNQATLDDPALVAGPVVKSASTMLTATSPTPLDGFEVSVPPPGWTETIVNDPGTDPDWTRESAGTFPTITPHSGGYMAKFNSYNAPANASARLWTNALDLSGYTAPRVVFWMSHDTGFSGNADRLQIQVSTDGVTWVDVGDPVLRYDASCTTACWKEHTVQLPAGTNVNGVYIGFLGISGYGNNFFLDDTALAEAWYPCPSVSLGPDGAQTACPGSSVEYSLDLDNYTDQTITFDVTVAGNAWATTPNPAQVTLAPGASGAIAVTVGIPWAGGADTATVTATGGGYSDSATLATSEAPGGLVPQPWESIDAISSAGRSRPATAVVNGKIYLFGGEISGTPNREDTVEMFDPAAGVWVDMAGLMPTPASNICAAAIGSDVYISGGYDTIPAYLDTLQVYHTTSDTWETIATDPLPAAKAGLGCAAVDGKLYVYGGVTTGGGYTNTAYVYDPAAAAGSRWTALPNMATTRGYLAGAAVNGKAYAVGGRDGVTADFTYVEAFDPADGLWHTVTAMSTGRGGPGAMVADDLLIACGGGWTTYLNTCEAYDTTQGYAGAWETLPPTMIQGRRTYGYASLPEAIYAVAGYNGTFLATAERTPIAVCEPPNPAITLNKTVGTDRLTCAATDEITLPAGGGEVTYCYDVTNIGDVTLNFHDLDDSELGNIFSGLNYALLPGASVFVTETTNIAVTTVNTGTWTAYNPQEPPVQATDVATVTVETANQPAISLNKTVGTTPGVCAVGDNITVTAGTEVYYCYVVENTGDVTFNFHDLVDSELGTILNDFPYVLAPGAFSPQVIIPATPVATVTNVGTWTAVTALGNYIADDTIPYNWQDISGTGTAVTLTDDSVSGALPIGFPFEFYGTSYSSIYISSNGFLTVLSGSSSGCCTGGVLPSTTTPNGVIAGWWEDFNPSEGGTFHYQTLGTAPNRVFIVQVTNVPHYGGGNLVTLQYKLFETTNTIEVHYQAAPSDGGTHSAGIENADGTLGLQYYYGTAALTTPLAVRYSLATVQSATDTDTATVTVLTPNIDVDPLSYNVTHAAPQVTTAPITIANTGQGDLTWNIAEEPTAVRPAPLAGGNEAAAAEAVDPSDLKPQGQPAAAAPLSAWRSPEAVLYDNGPLVTNPGAGAGGANVSALQTALGLNSYGFGNQASAGNRVADDFTVTGGGWLIDSMTFFGYQTGSSTTSTFTALNLRIWDGPPNDPGSMVVFGDTTTNRLASSTWANMYRTLDTALTNTDRPVMALVATVNTFLPAGTYWVDWQADGTLSSGPWAPPISIVGQTTTGNALQWTGAWAPLVDGTFAQGLPFIVEGLADCSNLSDVPWLSVSPANGVNAGGTSTAGTVSFDSTALSNGTYTARLCVFSNDRDTGPGNGTGLVIVPVTLNVGGAAGISLVKTVGTTAGVCAATSNITVLAGTTVYYCYTVTNTGSVTLNLHNLVDDQLGTIFSGLNYALTPGSSVNTVAAGLNIPAVINATTTNVGTWTAYNTGGPSVQATATATVTATPRTPNIDVDPLSLSSTQATNTTTQQTLDVGNTGDADLTWTIAEEPASVLAQATAASPAVPAAVASDTGSRGAPSGGPAPIEYTSLADFSEGFDDITVLPGWFFQNNSAPLGLTDWFQGNDTVFPAQAGAPDAYIGANFNNTAGVGTISNWLLTPQLNLANGDTISFWTRTGDGSIWPDRVELRLSLAGASTNVGTLATDVGDFTTLLLSVNPTLVAGGYPEVWTQYTATLSGIPGGASGRIAFRYFVTDGGPNGNNSNYIGIDTVEYVSAGLPQVCDAPSDVPWLSVSPTNGTTAPAAITPVQVTFDATGLAAGVYNANLCVTSNDPDPGPGNETELVIVPVELTVLAEPAIEIVKTVGTDPAVCATESSITVPAGTEVYYCYTVTNTGDITLNLHDLVDDQLGTIFSGLNYALTPGSSVNTVAAGLSISAIITAPTLNTATWTAYNAQGPSATATATAFVDVIYFSCENPEEDFEAGVPPWGWAVVNNVPGGPSWGNIASCGEAGSGGNWTGGLGDAACMSPGSLVPGAYDAELRTPVFSLVGYSNTTISFRLNYQNWAGIDELTFDISTDGGLTWAPLRTYITDQGAFQNTPGVYVTTDLAPYLGQANLMLRWRYAWNNPQALGWYAQIDEAEFKCIQLPPTAVTLDSLSATQAPLPVSGLPLAALPAVVSLALGAAYALRRKD